MRKVATVSQSKPNKCMDDLESYYTDYTDCTDCTDYTWSVLTTALTTLTTCLHLECANDRTDFA
jgi:hypothetical protein